ncbi:efflux RND transporter periplasmic adaptor subunit [Patescibacteria group bacterium]|nr:efflux RND transporter periplasmic adaptor subunit [Patescibacteria group bacterium]
MMNFLKKPVFYVPAIIIILTIIGGGYYYQQKTKAPEFDFALAQKAAIIQEVNVTGTVKPAESVELSFEKSGKVSAVNVKAGDNVKKGQLLVSLASNDLVAQLNQTFASLSSSNAQLQQYLDSLEREQTKLAEMKKGTRAEEIQISKNHVTNAELALADAEKNLETVKEKANTDLQQIYDSSASALNYSLSIATNTLYTITDLQQAYFSGTDPKANNLADSKTAVVDALLGAANAGRWNNTSLSSLNGGAKKLTADAFADPSETNVNSALTAMNDSLQKIQTTLEILKQMTELTATEQTTVTTAKNSINTELTSVRGKIQSIQVQKAVNQTSEQTAETGVTTARSNLLNAQAELNLKQAGYTTEQLSAQESMVRQAESNVKAGQAQIRYSQANVQSAQAQLTKNYLRSPIGGTVAEQNAKVGEIVSPNILMIKILSEANFEIETNVPEVDISKVKIDDTARVTLDAYGSDVIFNTRVIAINPAEIMIEGVATYKVTLQFEKENEQIKSGMTANIDILTDRRENTLAVPQRAVFTSDGKKMIRLANDDGSIKEIEVKTGLRGSDGTIEILEGVNAGDKVITFIKE